MDVAKWGHRLHWLLACQANVQDRAMISRAAFIERIAAAVLAGRRKKGPDYGEHYMQVCARAYAEDVARKLPGLFREERIELE